MLRQKLDDEEMALLEIVEDPIWFGEFMRSTADGENDRNVWPVQQWNYRDYQRQFLSDKTEFILYTGGRAIGKCQPMSSKILTVNGYQKISSLMHLPYFIVYALTPKGEVVQRRAVLTKDKLSPAYTIETESGHTVVATANHPILTPDGVYRLMADLHEGDYVAVTTKLPYESVNDALRWHELRILGYTLLQKGFRVEAFIRPRFKRIGAELERIADDLLAHWHKNFNGDYRFTMRRGPFKHPLTSLYKQVGLQNAFVINGIRTMPDIIMRERIENIQIFLEALFAQFATLTQKNVSIDVGYRGIAEDLQELLLRFGIESRITRAHDIYRIELLDYRAVYRFWKQFDIPGVSVGSLPVPAATNDPLPHLRYEKIARKYQSHKVTDTYAIHVYEHNNYISNNVYVHNTVVLEDKMVWDIINSPIEFPVTPEMVLVTANQAQMGPLGDRLILRFTSGKFLQDFLRNNVNKSAGTLTFPRKGKPFIFRMRIAGSRGEQNMVGLHIPKIVGDEAQLFPLPAYTQLMPAYNGWEPKRQQVWAGVPNGVRNSVLYLIDSQTPKYKKYRIPAPNNVMGYSYENYQDDLRRYGGEQDDRFQQLVLGRHGAAAYQVIPRESIQIETYPFYNMRYNSGHVAKGRRYDDVLQRPAIKQHKRVMFAIDPGFADPTIIQVLGMDDKHVWRTLIRYRLTRIDFNEQQNIIHWLDEYYKPDQIVIDVGAGGNGASIMHNMMYGDTYKGRGYDKKYIGVQFAEKVLSGYDDEGEELFQDAKSFAATELARIIQEGRLVFSEMDFEGISEMERVAKKKTMSGRDQFFVLSDTGNGASEDDHIFASFVCFTLATREEPLNVNLKKLAKPHGKHT